MPPPRQVRDQKARSRTKPQVCGVWLKVQKWEQGKKRGGVKVDYRDMQRFFEELLSSFSPHDLRCR